MAYPKGAKRAPGSGRKPGSPNQKTLYRSKAEEIISQGGLHPLEFLKAVQDNDWAKLGYKEGTKIMFVNGVEYEVDIITLDQRVDAAKNLAPYLVPKIATVTHKVDKTDPVMKEVESIVEMPTEQLMQEAKKLVNESD